MLFLNFLSSGTNYERYRARPVEVLQKMVMTGIPVVKGNQGFSLTPTVERGVDAATQGGRASGESAAGNNEENV